MMAAWKTGRRRRVETEGNESLVMSWGSRRTVDPWLPSARRRATVRKHEPGDLRIRRGREGSCECVCAREANQTRLGKWMQRRLVANSDSTARLSTDSSFLGRYMPVK